MKKNPLYFALVIVLQIISVNVWAQPAKESAHELTIPSLPFADNPDPNLCGIPQPWLEPQGAFLTGYYDGKLIEKDVFLYDSHLRRQITGQAPSDTKVTILLFQINPNLNYYLVRTLEDKPQEGWVPAPFVGFEDK